MCDCYDDVLRDCSVYLFCLRYSVDFMYSGDVAVSKLMSLLLSAGLE